MSIAHHSGTDSAAEITPAPGVPQVVSEGQGTDQRAESAVTRSGPRTRLGITCVGVYAAVVIALATFMVGGTGRAIYVLWMHGSRFVALALLVAVVDAILLTMILGAAGITQPRRLSRRHMPGSSLRSR